MSCTSKAVALDDARQAFRFFRDQIEGRGRHKEHVVQFVLDHFKIGDDRSEGAVSKYVKSRAR